MSNTSNTESSGVFRTKKGFTVIQNSIAKDRNLSLKAKGLYLTIMSVITMPDKTWHKSDFLSMIPEGEKAFENAWKELRNAGYIKIHCYKTKTHYRTEFELLEESVAGPHTFYYNSENKVYRTYPETTTIIGSTDPSERGGSETGMSETNPSATEVVCQGGVSNGPHINTNKTKNNTYTNTGDNTHSLTPTTSESEGRKKHTITLDPDTPCDDSEIMDLIRAHNGIPYALTEDPEMLTTAILAMCNWNANVVARQVPYDANNQALYLAVVAALVAMVTDSKTQQYKADYVNQIQVIDKINIIYSCAAKDPAGYYASPYTLGLFVAHIMSILRQQDVAPIKNPRAYIKAVIWDHLSTYVYVVDSKSGKATQTQDPGRKKTGWRNFQERSEDAGLYAELLKINFADNEEDII